MRIYSAAEDAGKLIVGGGASSVGLGGFIQGGGHGPMSSHYGLAADQILQARVITTDGRIIVANSAQNQDLLWAIRGGGAGQYGVVTEYVLKAHPAPTSAVLGTLSLSANGTDNSSINAAWNALATEIRSIPDLMDAGLAGQMSAMTGIQAGGVLRASHQFYGYNMTAADMNALVIPLVAKMQAQGGNRTLTVTFPEPIEFTNFTSFFQYLNPPATTGPAGTAALMSSRLLGCSQITNVTQSQLVTYLQRALRAQNSTAGGYLVMGMQGGKGPANVPQHMRGALHSSWRTAYVHAIAMGVTIDATANPQASLADAAEWVNENQESVWRDWAPEMGSYMNEANPFNPDFKRDYYGTSYERLMRIKKKYDPSESLFVLTGVGSDNWDYNLNTGKLCRTV
jgi:FAD/FMN-containing dehydrogenase